MRAILPRVLVRTIRCSHFAMRSSRVSIARAIVNSPIILLADEPTGNLDPQLSEEIMHLFEEFNRVGVTVLIASHNLDLITRMGYRILTLENGRMQADSDPVAA